VVATGLVATGLEARRSLEGMAEVSVTQEVVEGAWASQETVMQGEKVSAMLRVVEAGAA
jgi:hypothetical protein